MSTEAEIRKFLEREHPDGSAALIARWQEEVRQLGNNAPATFIEVLREGSRVGLAQDSAMMALRVFGYDTDLDTEDDPDWGWKHVFKIRAPGSAEWELIYPRMRPYDMHDPAFDVAQLSGSFEEYDQALSRREQELARREQDLHEE